MENIKFVKKIAPKNTFINGVYKASFSQAHIKLRKELFYIDDVACETLDLIINLIKENL